MAKRYYNLEKETKAFLKRMGDIRGVLPDGAGISRVNDYIIKKKGLGFLLGNRQTSGIKFESAKSQYLSIPSNSSLQTGTNGFTFSFWFQNITGNIRSVLTKCNNGGTPDTDFETYIGGNGTFALNVSNGTTNYTATTPLNTIINGTTYHIICNYDNIASTLNIYVNGVLKGTTAFVGSPLQGVRDFNIARRSSGALLLDGIVDEVGYWKRTLTTTEISYLYNSGQGRSYLELLAYNQSILTTMVSYWPLNEQGGLRRDWHSTNDLTSFGSPENIAATVNDVFYLS
jgi:hypothetical protein